uniref:PetM n=1 Tax=Schizocladia ischiensis TaxID=196139 RepID=A0A7S6ZPD8_9STRA|nr:PetM [Schizocladia ischiensis]QOW07593.1 PetM [Schizocladia ischiensis]
MGEEIITVSIICFSMTLLGLYLGYLLVQVEIKNS